MLNVYMVLSHTLCNILRNDGTHIPCLIDYYYLTMSDVFFKTILIEISLNQIDKKFDANKEIFFEIKLIILSPSMFSS